MYVIVVYDTERENCAVLHKYLKKMLFWNQRSVFEGEIRESQLHELKQTLEDLRADQSHITLYVVENAKLISREEIGDAQSNVGNVL